MGVLVLMGDRTTYIHQEFEDYEECLADKPLQVLANEYNAISLVIGYWTDAVPQWGWILIFWVMFLTLSNLGILAYGEMEFWLSL